MFAALLSAVLLLGQAEIVVEDIDTIAVCHVADGPQLVFFFARVQGEWSCIEHRWIACDMTPGRSGDKFTLAWRDDTDGCHRLVRSAAWIESWEAESPLANNDKPWWVRMCAPGFKQPQTVKP